MIVKCKCGKEIMTEGDAHVLVPTPEGYTLNCGCFFQAKIDKETKEALTYALIILDEIKTIEMTVKTAMFKIEGVIRC